MRAIVFFVEKQCLICSLAQPGAGIGGDRDRVYHTVEPSSDKGPRKKNPTQFLYSARSGAKTDLGTRGKVEVTRYAVLQDPRAE
jgi:hypothetical protein